MTHKEKNSEFLDTICFPLGCALTKIKILNQSMQGVFPPCTIPGIGCGSTATLTKIKQLLKIRE